MHKLLFHTMPSAVMVKAMLPVIATHPSVSASLESPDVVRFQLGINEVLVSSCLLVAYTW